MTFMMYVFCDSVCIGYVCVQTVTHPVEYNSLIICSTELAKILSPWVKSRKTSCLNIMNSKKLHTNQKEKKNLLFYLHLMYV